MFTEFLLNVKEPVKCYACNIMLHAMGKIVNWDSQGKASQYSEILLGLDFN